MILYRQDARQWVIDQIAEHKQMESTWRDGDDNEEQIEEMRAKKEEKDKCRERNVVNA